MIDAQQDEQRKWHEEQMTVLRAVVAHQEAMHDTMIRIEDTLARLVEMEEERKGQKTQ